jgi:hypothetical protein
MTHNTKFNSTLYCMNVYVPVTHELLRSPSPRPTETDAIETDATETGTTKTVATMPPKLHDAIKTVAMHQNWHHPCHQN